jgi:hypothetical protein
MTTSTRYVICVSNQGDELSVPKGTIYRVLAPEPVDRPGDIRLVDETGEDYLYDRRWFMEIPLPKVVAEAVEAA